MVMQETDDPIETIDSEVEDAAAAVTNLHDKFVSHGPYTRSIIHAVAT